MLYETNRQKVKGGEEKSFVDYFVRIFTFLHLTEVLNTAFNLIVRCTVGPQYPWGIVPFLQILNSMNNKIRGGGE